MSLYADYISERTDDKIIESPTGFATYRYIDSKTVYIIDLYVIPEARKKGTATQLADLIAAEARGKGCTEMLGTVVCSAKGSGTSVMVLFGYGMRLKSATNDVIVFTKEL